MQLDSARPLPGSSAERIPDVLQDVRIGRGTVRSEVDRSIRFRLEGTGPASTRELVADTRAAQALMSRVGSDRLLRALASTFSVADAHLGRENLASITLAPDEHSIKATQVLSAVLRAPRGAFDELTPQQARSLVLQQSAGVPARVRFAGAWNSNGHITVMPDRSRDFLASLGLYRIQPGDQMTKRPVDRRAERAAAAWRGGIHEVHHSITPRGETTWEWTRVFEESIAEVLSPMQQQRVMVAGGAATSLAARPARDTRHEVVDWPAWNRDHLPPLPPPRNGSDPNTGRYTDGPKLLRRLLSIAGIDRRTTIGRDAAVQLLQGERVTLVPARVAAAIAREHGIASAREPALAQLLRDAAEGTATIGEIERFVGV